MPAPLRVALLLLVAAPALAEDKPPTDKVQALVDKAWRGVKQSHLPSPGSYEPALTPPLPETWPPNGSGRLVIHAYARGMGPGLSDGEHIASPWGRVVLGAGEPKLEKLSDAMRSLGIQGVRPVAANSFPTDPERTAAEQAVATLARGHVAGTPTPAIQKAYCSWMRGNGVIVEAVRKHHDAFLRWLACP
jgi:hypothetical protein